MSEYELKDSGERRSFGEGRAVRDSAKGKPRPALISPFFTLGVATIMAKGAKKYAARNWEKGMPFTDVIDSLERHVAAIKLGMEDEDHIHQAGCNIMFLSHYREMIKRGLLPAELDDRPDYGEPNEDMKYEQEALDWFVDKDVERPDRARNTFARMMGKPWRKFRAWRTS